MFSFFSLWCADMNWRCFGSRRGACAGGGWEGGEGVHFLILWTLFWCEWGRRCVVVVVVFSSPWGERENARRVRLSIWSFFLWLCMFALFWFFFFFFFSGRLILRAPAQEPCFPCCMLVWLFFVAFMWNFSSQPKKKILRALILWWYGQKKMPLLGRMFFGFIVGFIPWITCSPPRKAHTSLTPPPPPPPSQRYTLIYSFLLLIQHDSFCQGEGSLFVTLLNFSPFGEIWGRGDGGSLAGHLRGGSIFSAHTLIGFLWEDRLDLLLLLDGEPFSLWGWWVERRSWPWEGLKRV